MPTAIIFDRRGFSYVAVLILTCALCVIAVSFLSRIGIGTEAVMARSNAVQAKYLAESAVNHAIWRLLNDRDFPADPNRYYMHNLGSGRYGYMVRRPVDERPGTIAAVGAVGGSVVMESYVIALPLAPGQIVTGRFTGNGALTRAVTGVGFRPDLVIVKNEGNRIAAIRSSSMAGDQSKLMTGTTALAAGLIKSLDNDGFTVGSNASVNEFGAVIDWAAFRVIAGQMAVGSYMGDGAADRIITGLGFTPSLVVIMPASAREMLLAIDGSADSFNFANSGGQAECLKPPFLAGGFRIGADARVNRFGEMFYYVCWPSIPGQQLAGTYVGNGVNGRDIQDVGFRPEYLFVRCISSGKDALHRLAAAGTTDDRTLVYTGSGPVANRIEQLIGGGFQVGSDPDCNENGRSYAWFAWIRK